MILSSASPLGVALSVAAAIAYAVPAAAASRLSERAARGALVAAWILHAATLATGLLASPPHFGFAPALSVTAWLVLTVYTVERQLFPQLQARWALAGLGAVAVLLAAVFPGAPLHVAASPWLPLHWALGIAAYGLFAAAVVHAWLMQRTERTIRNASEPQTGLPLLTLERLTFRFAGAGSMFQFGLALLISTFCWTVMNQADTVIAARKLSPAELGIYAEALFLTTLIASKFVPPLNEVAFPAYARLQEDRAMLAASQAIASGRLAA